MILCPNCFKEIGRETRQCPKFKGQPVCIDCCRKCDTYNLENMRCGYYIKYKIRDYSTEIWNITQEIKAFEVEKLHMKRKAAFLRNKNLAYKAVTCDMRVAEIDVIISKKEKARQDLIKERDKKYEKVQMVRTKNVESIKFTHNNNNNTYNILNCK